MRSAFTIVLRATAPSLPCRSVTNPSFLFFSTSRNLPTANTNANATVDGSSSSPNARVNPKVYNSNVRGSGSDPRSQLTEDQKEEVEEHNRYFAKKQDLGKKEKVDDKFWKGGSKG